MLKEVKSGTAPHSFGKGFVQSDFTARGLDELQAAYVCGTVIGAGSDTTSTQLNNSVVGTTCPHVSPFCSRYAPPLDFLMLITGILSRGREVIEKAWEELDRVVGSDRTPTFDDELNLPYIRAMAKEVMRWRFVNKFGTNHFCNGRWMV
jgi:hypothetical protein